ncbi:TPA: hypothetical protein HA278_03195 [Candidatus Woesearchaeota archaeon]|nr:hypothetical protein [Candidatus Woesearchaeota archaeon]
MREIKFRAWDKDHKIMFLPEKDTDAGVRFSDEYGYCRIHYFKNEESTTEHHECDCVWMQFTGLKDAGGKDVYEGDVIKYDESPLVNTIRFRNGSFVTVNPFCCKHCDEGYSYIEPLGDVMSKFTVIGNIYKNPELIQEKVQK